MSGTSSHSLSVSELTLPELLALFGRRKWILAIHLILGAVAGFMISSFSEPEFETVTFVQVNARTQTSTGFGPSGVLASIINRQEDMDLATEQEVIRNEARTKTWIRMGLALPTTQAQLEGMPDVKVDQQATSQVLALTVRARSSEQAGIFAKTLPEVYKEIVDARMRTVLSSAKDEISDKVGAADKKQKDLIAKLAKFQRDQQIADAQNEANLRATEQMRAENDLNAALASFEAAKAEVASLESEYKTIPATRTDVVEQTNREQIEAEKLALQRLQQQREQLLVKYFPDHRRVKEIDAAILKQEQYIASIPAKVSRTVTQPNPQYDAAQQRLKDARAVVKSAGARVESLRGAVSEAEQRKQSLAQVLEEKYKLQQQLEEASKTLTQLQGLQNELDIRSNDIQSPVTVVGIGGIVNQTKPRWTMNIVLAAMVGLLLGVFVAIARDIGLDRVNYPAEAVGIAGADILARIPMRSRSKPPLIDDPSKARAFEAYRLLRAGALMKMQQLGDGGLIVTSANRGEGKTVVAGNLAVAMALDGRRTCLVDANLRQPKVHKLFRVENDAGLADVLLDRVAIEAACTESGTPGLTLLTAGSELSNPTEALASPEMMGIIERLKASFDVVIFDAPEAYSVADTQELAKHVRSVLFVVELQQTNKTKMEQTIAFLRQSGARLIGLALNKDPQAKERIS